MSSAPLRRIPPLTDLASHGSADTSLSLWRRSGAAAVALSAAVAGARSRRCRSPRRRDCIAATAFGPAPPSATAADSEIVDVVPTGEGVIADVLEAVERDGVPVRSQSMEYARAPKMSTLASCGFAPLEAAAAAGNVGNLLVGELQASGVQDRDNAEVAAACICLMLRAVDEAHNLVTPLSWASPTPFGGPPKHGSLARQEAAYCHQIVHRMEGKYPGEFGTGFNNSNYWIGTAFPANDHPVFPAIRAAAEELAQGCREAQRAMRTMGPNWNPKDFNKVCEDAMLFEEEEMLEFCSRVQARELRLLFDHVAEGAGF